MNQLDERRRALLARGLEAFDRSVSMRRMRRRALAGGSALAVAAVALLAIERSGPVGRSGLPAHVEIIADDRDLAAELELARACERIDRIEGRLVVVECVAEDPPRIVPRPT